MPYQCRCDKSIEAGLRNEEYYEKVCVGMHVATLQRLVTYRGLTGRDAGRFFHIPQFQWAQIFHYDASYQYPAEERQAKADLTTGPSRPQPE